MLFLCCAVKECELGVEPKNYLWIGGGEGYLKFVAMAVIEGDGGTARKCCHVKSRIVRVKVMECCGQLTGQLLSVHQNTQTHTHTHHHTTDARHRYNSSNRCPPFVQASCWEG